MCVCVCPQHRARPWLPPLNVPLASANGQTLSQPLTGPAVCFSFFHLISSVTLSVFLSVKEAVIGRLVVQHLTPKLISTHAGISERRFSACVCVCLTGQRGHKHHPVDCGNTEDTYSLCCFCGTVDRQTSGRRTVKGRGCSVWDAAGQTQLDKQ